MVESELDARFDEFAATEARCELRSTCPLAKFTVNLYVRDLKASGRHRLIRLEVNGGSKRIFRWHRLIPFLVSRPGSGRQSHCAMFGGVCQLLSEVLLDANIVLFARRRVTRARLEDGRVEATALGLLALRANVAAEYARCVTQFVSLVA
jgi:hypothetical protein